MTTIWEVPGNEREIEGLDASGRPDPAYAAALGLVPAPGMRRAFAAVIDVIIYVLLQAPFWLFTAPLLAMLTMQQISVYGLVSHPQFTLAMIMTGAAFALVIAFCVVQLVLHGRKGVTIGKALFGLKSVNVATLERPGFWRIVLRVLVLLAASIVAVVLLLFLLSPLWDSERRGRGWHDKAGRLWMIDVRRGLNPYDEKRMRIARKMVRVDATPEAQELPSLATSQGGQGMQGYLPSGRTSAGVLGIARPQSPPIASGDSRPGRDAPSADQLGPAQIVMNVPGGLLGAPPAQASPLPPVVRHPAPAPQPRIENGAAGDGAAPAPPVSAPSGPVAPPPAPDARQAPPAAPSPPPSRPVYAVTLDTGQRIVLTGLVLVGRDPQPFDGYASAELIALVDEGRSISKTHLALRAERQGVEVIDVHSTNGTSIIHAGIELPLPRGHRGMAQIGDTVRFGDRTLVIDRPDTD